MDGEVSGTMIANVMELTEWISTIIAGCLAGVAAWYARRTDKSVNNRHKYKKPGDTESPMPLYELMLRSYAKLENVQLTSTENANSIKKIKEAVDSHQETLDDLLENCPACELKPDQTDSE